MPIDWWSILGVSVALVVVAVALGCVPFASHILTRLFCGWGSHEYFPIFNQQTLEGVDAEEDGVRIYLRCIHCDHETPGWVTRKTTR